MKEVDDTIFPIRLRCALSDRRIGLAVLSKATYIPLRTLYNYSEGKCAPALAHVSNIANCLSLPIDYLVNWCYMPEDFYDPPYSNEHTIGMIEWYGWQSWVGMNMKRFRKECRESTYGMAELMGLNQSQYSRLENGLRFPSAYAFAAVCGRLEESMDELLNCHKIITKV